MSARNELVFMVALLSFVLGISCKESGENLSEQAECLGPCSLARDERSKTEVKVLSVLSCYHCLNSRKSKQWRQKRIKDRLSFTAKTFTKRHRRSLFLDPSLPTSSTALKSSDCVASSEDNSVPEMLIPSKVDVAFGQYENTTNWYVNVSWTPINDSTGLLNATRLSLTLASTGEINCAVLRKNQTFLNINISFYGYRYPGPVHLLIHGLPYRRKGVVMLTYYPRIPTSSSSSIFTNTTGIPTSSTLSKTTASDSGGLDASSSSTSSATTSFNTSTRTFLTSLTTTKGGANHTVMYASIVSGLLVGLFLVLGLVKCIFLYKQQSRVPLPSGFSAPQITYCKRPLGLAKGQIFNGSITASSQENENAGPENARLNFTGAWSPLNTYKKQWLQVDFGAETRVTGISTQGHYHFDTWVESYTLRYSDDGSNFEQYQPELYTKTFSGNKDRNTVVSHELIPPIQARYIRVIPESYHFYIALRLEFYGCLANSPPPAGNELGFPSPTPAPYCEKDLGMESYAIPDSSVTAFSMLWAFTKPGNGRLHLMSTPGENVGGWVVEPNKEEGSWFQVDFGRWTKVTGISTQGRQGYYLFWVTKYRVSYSYDGIFFMDYKENGEVAKIFDGNTDQDTVVNNKMKNPIIARYIRIIPVNYHNTISLRAEFYGCRSGFSVPKISGCRKPLGMESGRIPNDSITASSSATSRFVGLSPANARLHYKGAPWQIGAWMPEVHDQNPWLQVDFGAETRVMGISTQGSYLNDFWVTNHSLQYRSNGSSFKQYQQNYGNKTFLGNTNGNELVSHELAPPIQACYIRVIPESWHIHIALRVEFYGCLASRIRNSSLFRLLSFGSLSRVF